MPKKLNIIFEINGKVVSKEEASKNALKVLCSSPVFLNMVKKELDKKEA